MMTGRASPRGRVLAAKVPTSASLGLADPLPEEKT